MTITMTVDHAHNRVLVRADGPITLDDILVHIEQERLAQGLPYSELIDARGYIPAFTPGDVRTVVSELRKLAATSRLGATAIVVDSDYGYGMLRMLEMLVEDVAAIRPFRRMEDAEQWLAEVGGAP